MQAGEGRDLLFLHGYLASKECFLPQISYFSHFYRVTALDFPGFGEAEPLTSPWSVSDYGAWTRDMVGSLNLKDPVVVAHSFGGRVAVKCMAKYDLFPKAVLCGCAGIPPKRGMIYKSKVFTYRLVKKFFPVFAEKKFGSAEYKTLSPVMKESYKKIVNEDLRKDAQKIVRPVLFVAGEKDKTTPLSSAKEYHRCVQGSRLFIMKGCGHFAFLEKSQEFCLAMEEFLR